MELFKTLVKNLRGQQTNKRNLQEILNSEIGEEIAIK